VDIKEELKSKIASVNQWQWLCFLPGIIFMVTGRHAIDAEHARNSALFRLVVIIVGLIIFCVLQVLKFGWKKQLKASEQAEFSSTQKPPIPPV
jgi:hypothetical protein